MGRLIRLVAALQLALLFPAALFLAAVLVGTGDAPQYELARVAQGIVAWYAARMWTLWLLLLILPLAVLAAGCATLLGSWNRAVSAPGSRRDVLRRRDDVHVGGDPGGRRAAHARELTRSRGQHVARTAGISRPLRDVDVVVLTAYSQPAPCPRRVVPDSP